MAIDRGPWNALVDDDGSNLVGSVWNKGAIKTVILDPVDALVGTRIDVPFGAFYGPEAGIWTVAPAHQITYSYSIVGKLATLGIFLYGTEISVAPTQALRIYYTFGTAAQTIGAAMPYTGPVTGTGYVQTEAGTNYLRLLRDIGGTPWPIGPTYGHVINLAFWLQ